jgi:hypothetical protein
MREYMEFLVSQRNVEFGVTLSALELPNFLHCSSR